MDSEKVIYIKKRGIEKESKDTHLRLPPPSRRVDNQVTVLSKLFLVQHVSCLGVGDEGREVIVVCAYKVSGL